MEQLIEFNGVWILLTTGETLSEVQSYLDKADVVISVSREWLVPLKLMESHREALKDRLFARLVSSITGRPEHEVQKQGEQVQEERK